jgi:hypothetical protein
MVKYDGKTTKTVTTKDSTGKEIETKVVIAEWEYQGPETQAEFDAWNAPTTMVSGTVKGQNGAADTPLAPTPVINFEAWKYGMSLKANQVGRAADTTVQIEDHKIAFSGKGQTDLDAYDNEPAKLAQALNMLSQLQAMGSNLGPSNTAKLAHKIETAIAAGLIHKAADGSFAPGAGKKNGPAVKK